MIKNILIGVLLLLLSYCITCFCCEFMIFVREERKFRKIKPNDHLKWKDEK